MHDVLKPFTQHPTQKVCKNFFNFEKSQKKIKNPKLRSKSMKCMIRERKKIIPDEENLIWIEDQVRKMKWLSLRSFGVKEGRIYWERLERNDRKIAQNLYMEKS